MPNFTQCAQAFMTNKTAQQEFGYNGPVKYIPKNTTTQISWQGCEKLCGTGAALYSWDQIASTLTTWILPIIGVILQAPFESNAFWSTCFALFRWTGNPIASLSYILWNIKVTGRCALLIDMAVPYDEEIPEAASDFGSMRDSLYILTTMNQFSMKPAIVNRQAQNTNNARPSHDPSPSSQPNQQNVQRQNTASGAADSLKNEGEGLLRIVLFSKDLPLKNSSVNDTLNKRRVAIAKSLRENRKRGVVPVFISIMWFLFALAISIEFSFNDIGSTAAAHDLGIGLLLAWLPVLILSGIVDRSAVSTDHVRLKLNKLIKEVCESLEDEAIREQYCEVFKNHPDAANFRRRVDSIVKKTSFFKDDYFVKFAGQGRVRWHYGAAQPILTSIERYYIAAKGRGWLTDEQDARTNLVLGPRGPHGLIYFDYRELFQVFISIVIVTCPVAGAFILSYWTPTVGLGCRTGGFVIFWVMSMYIGILEMAIFILMTPFGWLDPLRYVARRVSDFSYPVSRGIPDRIKELPLKTIRLIPATFNFADKLYTRLCIFMVRFSGRPGAQQQKYIEELVRAEDSRITERARWTLKVWVDCCIFNPLELINSAWLTYIVMAQGLGSYVTCRCQASTWASGGGYIDFSTYLVAKEHYLRVSWSLGTSISCAAMSVAMIYIVIEWCIQSHLNTENYEDACSGLRRTRQFRRFTRPVRELFSSSTVRRITWYTWHTFFTAEKVPQSFHNKDTLIWTHRVTNYKIRILLRDHDRPTLDRAPPSGEPRLPVRDRRGVEYGYGGSLLDYSPSVTRSSRLGHTRSRQCGENGAVITTTRETTALDDDDDGGTTLTNSRGTPAVRVTPSPRRRRDAATDESEDESLTLPVPVTQSCAHDEQHRFLFSSRHGHRRGSSCSSPRSRSRPLSARGADDSGSHSGSPSGSPGDGSGYEGSNNGSSSPPGGSAASAAAQAMILAALPLRRSRSTSSARRARSRASSGTSNTSYYSCSHSHHSRNARSVDGVSEHLSSTLACSSASAVASSTRPQESLSVPSLLPSPPPPPPSSSSPSHSREEEEEGEEQEQEQPMPGLSTRPRS